jgi:hypothetical protein
MKSFVADFETTTNPDNCHVWAYAICEVGNKEEVIIGTNIHDFMMWCKKQPDNVKVYFHNLKFDGQFILHWLFKNGFVHVHDRKDRATNTFTTLISDKGMYYNIEVIFYLKGKKVNKVIFQDSLKLIPLSVSAIAKTFKLPISKLSIDYKAHDNLPENSPLSKEEEEYIKNDVKIVAHAIEYFYSQGLDKMTIGSCALNEYKDLVKKRNFKRWFPPPEYHDDVKQSYRGGFTYLNPEFAGKVIGNGVVFDVNSLYPSVMYYSYLPFGTPIFFKGKYEEDEIYPLYTQMFNCEFRLKPGKIPMVQIKHSAFFRGNEYLTSSEDEIVTMCLNSVDMELFLDHYEVTNLEYISGWKFKATKGLFTDYIDKWSTNKINAKKEGNPGLYLISKLFLNSLYGKFGSDNKVRSKIPYIDEEENKVKYIDSEPEHKDPVYIAMASFITSYARYKTITSAQRVMDNYNSGKSKAQFCYADTDSLHICLNGETEEEFINSCGLEIDDTKLGAWKFESKFNKAKFLRQKCYIENSTEDIENDSPEYELKVTVAGMPKDCHNQVNFHNFKIGASYSGKKQPKIVPGGCVLKEVDFTIKR